MAQNKKWHDGLVVGLASAVRRAVVRSTPAGREKWGRFVGNLIWRMGKRRRDVAMANIGYAFPEYTTQQREDLARQSAMHFGRSVVDFMTADTWTKDSIEATTTIVGVEYLEQALAGGKGVLLITGHLGMWERLSAWVSLSGRKLSVIIRDANQEGVNQMVNMLRSASGTEVIPRGDAARPILTKLRTNQMVGIIPDQNTEETFIPFFGQLAGTVLGPGVIHERTGAAVLPGACFYVGEGRYVLRFYPLLEPMDCDGPKGEGLMRAINAWLESAIREHPEQWLWMHDRWRAAKQRGLVK
ncbi:MAG: lysophospholipid acyltransferase family protein [Armatimonadetes bacterium]|nr:lysophospholipid acyltransferase family protein [Armatimonadota bacterium]